MSFVLKETSDYTGLNGGKEGKGLAVNDNVLIVFKSSTGNSYAGGAYIMQSDINNAGSWTGVNVGGMSTTERFGPSINSTGWLAIPWYGESPINEHDGKTTANHVRLHRIGTASNFYDPATGLESYRISNPVLGVYERVKGFQQKYNARLYEYDNNSKAALTDNYFFVAAKYWPGYFDQPQQFRVYVYRRKSDNSGWLNFQTKQFGNSTGQHRPFFYDPDRNLMNITSIAASDDYLVFRYSSSLYLYRRTPDATVNAEIGENWVFIGSLYGPCYSDIISIYGNTIVVGHSGSTYNDAVVFEFNDDGITTNLQKQITNNKPAPGTYTVTQLGWGDVTRSANSNKTWNTQRQWSRYSGSVQIYNKYIAISGFSEGDNFDQYVDIYKKGSGSTWNWVQTIEKKNGKDFGVKDASIALHKNKLIIGESMSRKFYSYLLEGDTNEPPPTPEAQATAAEISTVDQTSIKDVTFGPIDANGNSSIDATTTAKIKEVIESGADDTEKNKKRTAALRLMFSVNDAVKRVDISKSDLVLNSDFLENTALVVRAGESINVNELSEGKGFYSALSNYESFNLVTPDTTIILSRQDDSGEKYKVSVTGDDWSSVLLEKRTASANFDISDPANSDNYIQIGDVLAVSGRYISILGGAGDMGSVSEYKVGLSKAELKNNLGVSDDNANKMGNAVVNDLGGDAEKGEVIINDDVKNSIIKTSGGVKDTKRNIRKKRREFMKILFAKSARKKKLKMSAVDIGLDETLKEALGNKQVKQNVLVIKKNQTTAIDVSTDTSADTALYAELDTVGDSIKLNLGELGVDATVSKTRDEDGATTAQWTISYGGNEYIKEEGDQITLNSVTLYIGSVYTDGSNSGINQNGPTSLTDLYIPFVDDTNVVASNDAIRTKRHSRINNIFGNNPTDISFTALSSELGLDKTVGDKIKTNTKVLKANSTLDLNPATTDISNNLSAHVNIKAVGEYALIEGLTGGNFRIQVVADGEYQLRSADGNTALVENKYKDGEQVTFRDVTFYFGSVSTNNSNDGVSGDTVLDLASLNIRFDIEKLQDGQVQANEVNNVVVVNDNGNNKYSINGSTIPTLYLFKGKTYRFNQTDGTNGGHPMKLYLEADKTTEYSNGVDISGTPGTDGYLEITVADDAPEELHYQCGAHPNMGGVFKIVSVNNTITSLASLSNIRYARHRQLRKIFKNNPSLSTVMATSKDLGMDVTVGKTVKKQVIVYRANASSEVDLTDPTLITSKQGVYGDLKEVGDYLDFNTGHNNGAFRVKVNTANPKTYVITNIVNDTKLLEPEFTDGQWVTFRGVTLYFGGVYTSGTNDGITAADPYVFPINGNPYKLPDKVANYCLYADNNTFITGLVRQLSKVEQNKMREWVIERLGSDTNKGANLVTDGFFYSAFHINTSVGELYLDLETKVCNTNNKGVFKVDFNNTRDNTYLFKGEHKITATISWKVNGNTMALDVDFFENPQIRNGIRINTLVSRNNQIGLLMNDYDPTLLRVKNPVNKLSKYNNLLKKVLNANRVTGDNLNLQKKNELWSRHTL